MTFSKYEMLQYGEMKNVNRITTVKPFATLILQSLGIANFAEQFTGVITFMMNIHLQKWLIWKEFVQCEYRYTWLNEASQRAEHTEEVYFEIIVITSRKYAGLVTQADLAV